MAVRFMVGVSIFSLLMSIESCSLDSGRPYMTWNQKLAEENGAHPIMYRESSWKYESEDFETHGSKKINKQWPIAGGKNGGKEKHESEVPYFIRKVRP